MPWWLASSQETQKFICAISTVAWPTNTNKTEVITLHFTFIITIILYIYVSHSAPLVSQLPSFAVLRSRETTSTPSIGGTTSNHKCDLIWKWATYPYHTTCLVITSTINMYSFLILVKLIRDSAKNISYLKIKYEAGSSTGDWFHCRNLQNFTNIDSIICYFTARQVNVKTT